MGWNRIEYKTLFNHGNSIKFNVINMEKLFYLKATRRTNNHYKSLHVIK